MRKNTKITTTVAATGLIAGVALFVGGAGSASAAGAAPQTFTLCNDAPAGAMSVYAILYGVADGHANQNSALVAPGGGDGSGSCTTIDGITTAGRDARVEIIGRSSVAGYSKVIGSYTINGSGSSGLAVTAKGRLIDGTGTTYTW